MSNRRCDVLRLDLMHETVNGNKWFKLKRNIEQAISKGCRTILTFGGAASNHIAATAAASHYYGLNSVGIIRGEAMTDTLQMATSRGMKIHFVTREQYNRRNEDGFIDDLCDLYGEFYHIPEGGNNASGVMGCSEIIDPDWNYDYIFCACGTGATFAGITATPGITGAVVGISVLKGENVLPWQVQKQLAGIFPGKNFTIHGNDILKSETIGNSCIINSYAFNGYAAFSGDLIAFKTKFESEFEMPLDHVYTSKLFFAINDLLQKEKIGREKSLLIVHSGGLQGNKSFEQRYQHKLTL